MRRHLPFLLILAAYLLVGSLYAVYTPAWQAPDEPAHYNYIVQLAAGEMPVIRPGDYDQAYFSEVISSRFSPEYEIAPFRYENWQPPLYYLLQTPVFWLFGGALLPLRLFSLLLGAGLLFLTRQLAAHIFGEREWLTFTAVAFVAFLPQHLAMMAAVNNDSLAGLMVAAILLLLIRQYGSHSPVEQRGEQAYWLGLLLGLGFLTKATVYIMAPLVGAVMVWRHWGDWAKLWRALILCFGPAGLIGGLWWLRNLIVYDGFDPLGIAAHDAVVVGQLRTADWIADIGLFPALGAFFRTTFQSFWGQFGWMGVPMPVWVYQILLGFTAFVMVGLFAAFLYAAADSKEPSPASWFILAALTDLTVLLYLYYNWSFVQHQGRYLFPAIIPIAIGVASGLGMWIRPLRDKWRPSRWILPVGLTVALIGLDLLALFRFILPALGN
jgi:4-amino-4-deoxy-L-arabinose transferase-like glycosyltransferase